MDGQESQRDEKEEEGGRWVYTEGEENEAAVKGEVGKVRLCMAMAAEVSIDLERVSGDTEQRE